MNGKLLRVTTTGAPAPGNPFLHAAGAVACGQAGLTVVGHVCQEIYDFGLRNPFRVAFDPNTSVTNYFINDVGLDTWEEVDAGRAGANYGWNVREGPCARGSTTNCGAPPAGMTNPFLAYSHATGCNVITGGAFVPDGAWPGYDHTYLYTDFGCGRIFLASLDCGTWTTSTFATGITGITDFEFIGNQLWYSTIDGGVSRIVGPPSPPPGPTSRLVPITPIRKLDTRIGLGGSGPVPQVECGR